jgi:hypothetical protein
LARKEHAMTHDPKPPGPTSVYWIIAALLLAGVATLLGQCAMAAA